MFFQRRQYTEIALDSSAVVVANITLNRLDKRLLAVELLPIVALSLQDSPEALHGSVVDTPAYAGHALYHTGLFQLVVKGSAGVLESPVAVEERMRVRVGRNCPVQGLENQRVIVAFTDHIRHDAPVAQIENGAEIELMYRDPFIPFEFRHIREPFLVGLVRVELPVQEVLGQILRILCVAGTAVAAVLDGGLDPQDAAYAQHPLVVDADAMVVTQAVIDPPVAHLRVFSVDLFHHPGQLPVPALSGAGFPRCPFVIRRARHTEDRAAFLYRIPLLSVQLLYGGIVIALSYLRKAFLLSISSNFFSRSRSISARYSLCLSSAISICAFSSSLLGA